MSKIDITINRKMTINTGNYSSIGPGVSLTLKDVDSGVIVDTYKKLSEVMDVLMLTEIVTLSEEALEINKIGYKKYVDEVKKIDNPLNSIKDILKDINTIEIKKSEIKESLKIL